jgi:putative holliday junction resolvase
MSCRRTDAGRGDAGRADRRLRVSASPRLALSATLFPMRVLAIDFGERRIGLATSDATETLATPRRTLERRGDVAAVQAICRFCHEEEIGLIVIGLPRSPEGLESAFAARVRSFAAKLSARTPIPIRFQEETLTSNEARRRLPPGSPREDVDRMAAAVLLEDYLKKEPPPEAAKRSKWKAPRRRRRAKS